MIQEESVMVEVTENDNNAVCRNRLTDPGAMIWPMTAKVNKCKPHFCTAA